jgi:exodeoxyribonuclease VII large subunit
MDSSFRWNARKRRAKDSHMSFIQNQAEYSVSEIAGHVKRMVEDTFGFVRVRGEISKASVNSASGHCYLTMKDDKAILDAVVWKGTMARLAHKPQAGMEMIATGKLTTYPGASKYQLVIDSLEPAGIGALMAMLEARKKALAAEGLFAPERKKPLPFLPQTIGIITSPTGAVIRDILHRLADRFPRHVLLWPVPVQGAGAAEKIAEAIAGFNALPAGTACPDVIIVARGGGSIEDLWAFNEEVVVRAAAASRIPLISAVGHETDTTLIDYAADRRAPTPTAAAEMAVPVRDELLAQLEQLTGANNHAIRSLLNRHQERVTGLARGLPRPQQLVASMAQALDMLGERLQHALPRSLQLRHEKLQRLMASLSPRFLGERLLREEQRVNHLAAMLESLNVLSVLKRGFALVKDAGGQVMKSAAAMPEAGAFTVQFHDGERVLHAGGAAPTKRSAKAPAKQPGLFD